VLKQLWSGKLQNLLKHSSFSVVKLYKSFLFSSGGIPEVFHLARRNLLISKDLERLAFKVPFDSLAMFQFFHKKLLFFRHLSSLLASQAVSRTPLFFKGKRIKNLFKTLLEVERRFKC